MNLNDEWGQLYDMVFIKQEWGIKGNVMHYRFEQDESLTKSATHSENAIKSI